MDGRKSYHNGSKGYSHIKTEDIIKLYVSDKRTTTQIAEMFGISRHTVYKRLKRAGINTKHGHGRIDVSTEDIIDMYIVRNIKLKEIAEHFDVSYWTVIDRLHKAGITKRIKHHINHNAFDQITPGTSYWAGFIAADGSIHRNYSSVVVELSRKDERHLKKLCRFVGRDENLWYRTRTLENGKKFRMASMSILSFNICKNLEKYYSVIPDKTFTLQPPSDLDAENKRHFIRGFIDGDGTISWHKHNHTPRIGVVGASLEIIEWIKKEIKNALKLKYNPKIAERPRKKENGEISITYRFEFQGKYVYNILNWLYADSKHNTRLDRKFERYKKYGD